MRRSIDSLIVLLLLWTATGCTEVSPPDDPGPNLVGPPVQVDPVAGLTDADPDVRRHSVERLAAEDPAALARRLGAIAADADRAEELRLFALGEAARLGRKESVEKLVALMADEPGGRLRNQLRETLIALTGRDYDDPRQWQAWYRDHADASREQWLQEALRELRRAERVQAERIDRLSRRLGDMLINDLRRSLARLDGDDNDNGDKARLDLLERALAEPLLPVKTFALQKIGEARPAGALPLVEPYLEHADEGVRAAAVKAFAELRPPGAGRRLVGFLDDAAWQVRLAALEGLTVNRLPEAREDIEKRLNDSSVEVAWKAAQVLGELGDAKAVKVLVGALGHPEERVRWWSAYALGQLRDPAAVKPLTEAYNDAFTGVQEAILRALGAIGSPAAAPMLKRVMADEKQDEKLRQAAWNALVQVLGANFDLAAAEIRANIESGRTAHAIELFETVSAAFGDRPELKARLLKLRLDFVDHYIKADMPDKALALVRMLAEEDRELTNPNLQIKRLQLEIDRRQSDAGASLVDKLIDKCPKELAARFDLLKALVDQVAEKGRLRRARDMIDKLKVLQEQLPADDVAELARLSTTVREKLNRRIEADRTAAQAELAKLDQAQTAEVAEALRKLDGRVVAEQLVQMLDADAEGRRRSGIDLLKLVFGITGGFGYEPGLPAAQRAEAVKRWRSWMNERAWD